MGNDRSFGSICGCSQSPLFAIEGVAQGSQCNDDSGLRAQDQAAERGLHLAVTMSRPEFPIGPEGGWTDREFGAAHCDGYVEASLGRLILRTETAVVVALASLSYALDSE